MEYNRSDELILATTVAKLRALQGYTKTQHNRLTGAKVHQKGSLDGPLTHRCVCVFRRVALLRSGRLHLILFAVVCRASQCNRIQTW